MFVLIEQTLGTSVELLAGGGIVRAENRHMLELLNPPLRLVTSIELPAGVPLFWSTATSGGQTSFCHDKGSFQSP